MEVPEDIRCRQVQGRLPMKKKQSTGVGKRTRRGTTRWTRPRGNMLNVVAAVRIAASPTIMIEQKG